MPTPLIERRCLMAQHSTTLPIVAALILLFECLGRRQYLAQSFLHGLHDVIQGVRLLLLLFLWGLLFDILRSVFQYHLRLATVVLILPLVVRLLHKLSIHEYSLAFDLIAAIVIHKILKLLIRMVNSSLTVASLVLLLIGSRSRICWYRALFKAILGKTVVNSCSVETHVHFIIGHGEVRHAQLLHVVAK